MTSGSGDDGNMLADFAQFDLEREIADSERSKPWQSGRNAKTLFKKKDFRLVLITIERGAQIREHHADGTISVQVVKGKVRVSAQGKTHDLPAASLLTLAPSIKHDVEALEDSAFLLTISWPADQQLQALAHRGYGT